MNKDSKKQNLVILSGPTASGKTRLSVELARRTGGEIISADSMQVYRGMNIGTAKVRKEEMQGVRHHLIDCVSPFDEWSVSVFKDRATEAIEDIASRGHLPIIAGGTGFYIQAVLYDVDFDSEGTDEVKKELAAFLQKYGAHALHERLRKVDEASARAIHENNVKRTLRALEFFLTTGRRISEHNEEQRERDAAYNSAYFVLDMDRDALYRRIDERVDIMLKDGLVDEVRRLLDDGCRRDMVSMQGLGYKEIIAYLSGEASYEEAVRILKRDTRHFAKRQMTWFRRERDVIRLCREDFKGDEEMLKHMLDVMREREIV